MDATSAMIKEIERHLNIAENVILRLANDNERMRAALQKIVTEADSDNGLTAWDGADIARRALEK